MTERIHDILYICISSLDDTTDQRVEQEFPIVKEAITEGHIRIQSPPVVHIEGRLIESPWPLPGRGMTPDIIQKENTCNLDIVTKVSILQ